MVKIGLLGCGTIGSGVVELLAKEACHRNGLSIEKILVRNKDKHNNKPYGSKLTNRFEDILKSDIDIVVEVMGGIDPAYFYVKQSLLKGRHVVTANKDLIAKFGNELQKIARQNGVRLLFEASVGGGIPIIKPLSECLAVNSISEVKGIVNGTTNFILSRMANSGMTYEAALKEAQQCGYAEANPEADVMGFDAARKLAILSSIAYRSNVDYEDIYIEGINNISADDISIAKYLGCSIKLLALSRRTEKGIMARVAPVLLRNTNPLAGVADVYNAIIVKGDAVGDVLFFGQGAGKLPTASAVVGDIFDIVRHSLGNRCQVSSYEEEAPTAKVDMEGCSSDFFIRIKPRSRVEAMDKIAGLFERFEFVFPDRSKLQRPVDPDQIVFIAYDISEGDIDKRIKSLKATTSVDNVLSILRIEREDQ
ncbi:MAG: homoserine dehydrogenase [Clostridia bacterium]|jgi:homoserine dehydrogenase|nr:homoserine dehydrogenase [Clostridiales bacterium]